MAKSKKMSKRMFARNFVSKMVKGRNLMTKSGIKKEYNGWSNYETWGFMLIWSNDYGYANFAEEIKSECADMDELKERVRQEVEMVLDDVQEYINGGNQFVQQLCINATEEVDVDECVESICDGIEFDEDYEASAKKSKGGRMAKGKAVRKKYGLPAWSEYEKLQDSVLSVDSIYSDYENGDYHSTEEESSLYNEIANTMDELTSLVDRYYDVLAEIMQDADEFEEDSMSASTKKSKLKRMNKALAKLGGFTKEDEDSEEEEEEVEVESEEEEDGEDVEVIVDEESEDESEKGCKSRKSLRTSKKRMKMRKAEEMPEDADDQQDINQKGSGNAGSELPEDADDVKEVNQKGSGNAGADLPEDADDAEDQKQARAKKMRSRKNVRKFSVTPGGSPNQESYIDRYNQAPTVRRAIDNHFGSNANKSFDEAQMLQDRIDAMAKSRRNSDSNNVPMRIRKR